jgi:hypothetical protein
MSSRRRSARRASFVAVVSVYVLFIPSADLARASPVNHSHPVWWRACSVAVPIRVIRTAPGPLKARTVPAVQGRQPSRTQIYGARTSH